MGLQREKYSSQAAPELLSAMWESTRSAGRLWMSVLRRATENAFWDRR